MKKTYKNPICNMQSFTIASNLLIGSGETNAPSKNPQDEKPVMGGLS